MNTILSYKKKSIRILIRPDGAWLAAADVFAANNRRTDRRTLSRIDRKHLKIETFPSPTGAVRLTAVSPLGVATIAQELPPPLDRILDAWVRREADNLADLHGSPRLEMTLLADGTLPVRPRVDWASYADWQELKRRHPVVHRNVEDRMTPALFDDDPSLPAHDPVGDLAAFRLKFGL